MRAKIIQWANRSKPEVYRGQKRQEKKAIKKKHPGALSFFEPIFLLLFTFLLLYWDQVLVIHVNRIRWDGAARQKLHSHVRFPLTGLDMRPFLAPHASAGALSVALVVELAADLADPFLLELRESAAGIMVARRNKAVQAASPRAPVCRIDIFATPPALCTSPL